jgi:hypothetical protein
LISQTACSTPAFSKHTELTLGYVQTNPDRNLTRRIIPGIDLRWGSGLDGVDIGWNSLVVIDPGSTNPPPQVRLGYLAPAGWAWTTDGTNCHRLGFFLWKRAASSEPNPVLFKARSQIGLGWISQSSAAELSLGYTRATHLAVTPNSQIPWTLQFDSRHPDQSQLTPVLTHKPSDY